KTGKKVAIFGDTRCHLDYASFIESVDVLVHEATFAANNEQLADEYYHSTTREVASLAKEANIETLLCTHISSRYQDSDKQALLQQLQATFPNSIIAEDFFTYVIS